MSFSVTPYDELNLKLKLWKENKFRYFLPKKKGNILEFPKQIEAWNIAKNRDIKEFAYGGGAGGSKSHTIATFLLFESLTIAGLSSFIGRKNLTDIKKSVVKSLFKAMRIYNIPKELVNYNKQDSVFYFKNGSHIDLIPLEYKPSDPEYSGSGSIEYSYGWIEEAQEVEVQAFDSFNVRLGRQYELYDEIGYIIDTMFITMNPMKNWVYDMFYLPNKNGTIENHRYFLKVLAHENPTTPKSYLTKLDNIVDPIKRARLRDGEWEYDDNKKALFPYTSISNMFDFVYPNSMGKSYYISFDIARKGEDSAIGYLFNGYTVIAVAIAQKCIRQEIEAIIDGWKNEYGIPNDNISIDANGMGEGYVDSYIGCFEFKSGSSPVVNTTTFERANSKNPSDYQKLRDQVYFVASDLAFKEELQFAKDLEIIKFGDNTNSFAYDRTILMAKFRKELEQVCEMSEDDDKKKRIIPKKDIKRIIKRSPDHADGWVMRFVFDADKYMNNNHEFTVGVVEYERDNDYDEIQKMAG